MKDNSEIIGGGFKKVLYTLGTVKRIGISKSAKALKSHNTCKACGLGMGGQRGGMVNELDEFPSVCNKSVQAQSSDTQAPIPEEVFEHTLEDFKQLSGKEMESLGRLNTPLYKVEGENRYQPIDWPKAMQIAADAFAQTDPLRSFFYSSGRSSNEAGFVLQLLARLYGTNNVSNCSFYCHQATGVGLANSIGTGTATVELDDLKLADCIFVIGANPASNHPRFIHQLKKCRDRGGEVIVVNPAREPGLVKFAVPKSPASLLKGGDEIASHYVQPHIGGDWLLLSAIAKALIESGRQNSDFIDQYTSNYQDWCDMLSGLQWQGIEQECGVQRDEIQRIAQVYANSQKAVFAWGMGITHHTHGVENVEAISNLALLRGMVGQPGAGLLPLRGHSNVQGIGTMGVKPVLAADVFEAMEKHFGISLPQTPGMDTLACLQTAHDGNMDAALLMGGNLYQATPDSDWAQTALNRIGFKLHLTTTLNQGHVHGVDEGSSLVLPVTARDEEWQPTTQESMFNYVRLSDGGIHRLDNVHPESHILSELAEKLLPESPVEFSRFKQHDSIRQAIAAIIPEMAQLKNISVAKEEFHVKNRLLHTPEFKTKNGRARFIAQVPESKNTDQDYPLRLMSIRSEGQFNSIIYEEHDSYRGTESRDTVLMNQQDMLESGINHGERISLESATGKMENVVCQAFDLPRGNVMAYYPEANVLIGREHDSRSKTPAFKHVQIRVVNR